MHKRFVATTILGVALLFSQGATVLVATLCPHLRFPAASCFTEIPASAISHEHMDHMQTDPSESEPPSEENAKGVALGLPLKPCAHCAVHSRSAPDASSLRETEAAKRSGHLNIPLALSRHILVPTSSSPVLTSRAHGPPGEAIPRHLLLNVFRN